MQISTGSNDRNARFLIILITRPKDFRYLVPHPIFMENTEQGKAEKAFKNFGKRLDDFIVEVNEASDHLQKEFKSRFEELKESAEELKKQAKDKERWKEVEASLKKAGEQLNTAFKAAFKKKEGQ